MTLDLTMPALDSTAAPEHRRALKPHLPVILSGGYDRCELEEFPIINTGVSFLQKPYALDQLQQELLGLLNPDLEYNTYGLGGNIIRGRRSSSSTGREP